MAEDVDKPNLRADVLSAMAEVAPKHPVYLYGTTGTVMNQMVDAIMPIIEQQLAEREQAAVNRVYIQEHFYKYTKRLDAYGNCGYYCECAFVASSKEALDGHVDWKKTELVARYQSQDKETK